MNWRKDPPMNKYNSNDVTKNENRINGDVKKSRKTSGKASIAGEADKASQTSGSAPAEAKQLPDFKFSMANQPLRKMPGGTAREATAREFPVSQNIAAVLMTLRPGGLRELHWHANAAEWAYIIEGSVRVTILDPQGRLEIADFVKGDIWYFPRGHVHSIQGLGPGKTEAKFLLVFDNGYFSEFATFSISDWLAQTPKEIVAKNLNVSPDELTTLPKSEVYIAEGPVPPKTGVVPISGPGTFLCPPLSHKYQLRSQKPFVKSSSGEVRLASAGEFPISTTMTGALMTLHRGGLRELHWHPNADEWQYVLSGKIRLTVFASSGLSSVVELEPGDIGFAPMGYGHALENVGEGTAELILVFNSGDYQELSISTVIAAQPSYLLESNLYLPEAVIKKLPRKQEFITSGHHARP